MYLRSFDGEILWLWKNLPHHQVCGSVSWMANGLPGSHQQSCIKMPLPCIPHLVKKRLDACRQMKAEWCWDVCCSKHPYFLKNHFPRWINFYHKPSIGMSCKTIWHEISSTTCVPENSLVTHYFDGINQLPNHLVAEWMNDFFSVYLSFQLVDHFLLQS